MALVSLVFLLQFSAEMEPIQIGTSPRRPHILLAASGSVAAIKFGNLCRAFSEWAEVRAVVTSASLNFIDRASIPSDVVVYTDEDEWSSWQRIGDGVLHIELRRWADIMVIAPLSANTLGKVSLSFFEVFQCFHFEFFFLPNVVCFDANLSYFMYVIH